MNESVSSTNKTMHLHRSKNSIVEKLNEIDQRQPSELIPVQSEKIEYSNEEIQSNRLQRYQEKDKTNNINTDETVAQKAVNEVRSNFVEEEKKKDIVPLDKKIDQNRSDSSKKMPPNCQKKSSSRNVLKKYNASYFDAKSKQNPSEFAFTRFSHKSTSQAGTINNFAQHSKLFAPRVKDEPLSQTTGSRLSEKKLCTQQFELGVKSDLNLINNYNLQKPKTKLLCSIQPQGKIQTTESLHEKAAQHLTDLQIELNSQEVAEPNEHGNRGHEKNNHNAFVTPVSKLQQSNLLPKNFSESRKSLQTNRISSSKPTKNQTTTEKNDLNFLKCNEVVRYSDCKTEIKVSTANKNLTSDTMFVAKPMRPDSFRKIDPPKIKIDYILDPKKNPTPAKYNISQTKPESIPLFPIQPNVIRQTSVEPLDLQKRPSSLKLVPNIEIHQLTDTQQKIEKFFSNNSRKVDPQTCFNSKREHSKHCSKGTTSKLLDPRKTDCARCDEKNTPVSWQDPPELFKSKVTVGFRQSANSIVAEYIRNPNIMQRYSEKKENVFNDEYKQMLMEKRQINELKNRHSKLKFLVDKEAADKIKHDETDPTQMLEYNKEYVG